MTTPEAAHDVLAADEFAVPAPDPELHHQGPVHLPEDPGGDNQQPHDVLAAEEFPMPAPRQAPGGGLAERPGGYGRLVAEIAVGLLGGALLRRLVTRRRR